jgi:hypothetical protein
VKNRFQSLPFKFNLQRYTEELCVAGRVGIPLFTTTWASYWLKAKKSAYISQSDGLAAASTILGLGHFSSLYFAVNTRSIDDSQYGPCN